MNKVIEMLMVEDNPGDVRLSQEYLKEYKVPSRLKVVKDVLEAQHFLQSQAVDMPDIILISIRALWRNNSLLKQIQCNPLTARIPLVILTAFDGEEANLKNDLADILCISKPLNLDCQVSIMKHLAIRFSHYVDNKYPET
ncbi:MAG: response regulator [Anaerolineae bacterium]|nr:response regulator [Anaerolineae bacterium]